MAATLEDINAAFREAADIEAAHGVTAGFAGDGGDDDGGTSRDEAERIRGSYDGREDPADVLARYVRSRGVEGVSRDWLAGFLAGGDAEAEPRTAEEFSAAMDREFPGVDFSTHEETRRPPNQLQVSPGIVFRNVSAQVTGRGFCVCDYYSDSYGDLFRQVKAAFVK